MLNLDRIVYPWCLSIKKAWEGKCLTETTRKRKLRLERKRKITREKGEYREKRRKIASLTIFSPCMPLASCLWHPIFTQNRCIRVHPPFLIPSFSGKCSPSFMQSSKQFLQLERSSYSIYVDKIVSPGVYRRSLPEMGLDRDSRLCALLGYVLF